MLLQILQPPVVPVLHDLHPELFSLDAPAQDDLFTLPFLTPLPSKFESKNQWSLGQLFAGFMRHYDRNFDFTADVASVRTGKILTNVECTCKVHVKYVKWKVCKACKVRSRPKDWNAYVCVEDPLDRSNVGRTVRRREHFDRILHCLDTANRNPISVLIDLI